MYIERTLETTILKAAKSFPVILVTGPRQIGKTTLLQRCLKGEKRYVTLDSINERMLAKRDPELFLKKYPPPLFIDEVQYAPELFQQIKLICDRERRPDLFWLSGSQKFHLMQHVSDSLAGRVAIIDLLGLSQAELSHRAQESQPVLPTKQWLTQARNAGSMELMDIYRRIWLGAFPQVALGRVDRDLFYSSYVQTYIQRDVREITNVTNEVGFYDFLRVVAARSGQLLNYAELAKDANINHRTVKEWLHILEASSIIYLLRPYHVNTTNRLIKTPKVFFLDTGLCSYLTRWQSPESLEAGAMSGALFETYVFSEILKSYWHNGKQPYCYFYRDKEHREVDLLFEQDNTLYPIEIKKTTKPNVSFKALEKLNKNIGHGFVVCFVERDIPLSNEVDAISVGYL